MQRAIAVFLSFWLCGFVPRDAAASTVRVPADALTIQIGIDAASVGDTVLVAPGGYTGPGNWNLDFHGKDLVLTSEAGASQTILDGTSGQGQWVRGLFMGGGETRAAVVEGLTFQNFLHSTEGSGVLVGGVASPTVRDCVFFRNQLGPDSPNPGIGGMSIQVRETAAPVFLRCRIAENGAPDWGTPSAAVNVEGSAVLRMEDCVITGNVGSQCSGLRVVGQGRAELVRCEVSGNLPYGIDAESTIGLEDCVLVGNVSPHGGAVRMRDGVLRGCTFAANEAEPGGGGLAIIAGGDVLAERCIFYGNCANEGTQILTWGRLRLSCCAVPESGISTMWGSGSVEWLGPNIGGDPRFCDLRPCPDWPVPVGDYHLRSDSPCLPQFSPCGQLIGALDQGCLGPEPLGACCIGTTCCLRSQAECVQQGGHYQGDGESCYPDPCLPIPTIETSWGRIKAKYR